MKILFSMVPSMKVGDVKEECKKALDGGYEYICLPQWFVSFAKDELSGASCEVATIISLPGGTTSTAAKFAEIKQAVANGAKLVIIPVNMKMVRSGDITAAKGDFSGALVACGTINAKKAEPITAALVDGEGLEAKDLDSVMDFCFDCGAASVLLAHNDAALASLEKKYPGLQKYQK